MKHGLAAVAAVYALCAGAGGQASAAILEYDWSGTVFLGSDQTGVFGVAGANLTGDSYTARFIFDDTLGTRFSEYRVDNIVYNPIINVNSPALSATLTINNVSVTFDTSGTGNANNDPQHAYECNSTFGPGTFASPNYSIINESLFGVSYSPPTLEANFSAVGSTGNYGNYFQIAEHEPTNPDTPQARGLLLPSMVSERVISAAPEPSTWVLMMTGVFGGGLATRRRRFGDMPATFTDPEGKLDSQRYS